MYKARAATMLGAHDHALQNWRKAIEGSGLDRVGFAYSAAISSACMGDYEQASQWLLKQKEFGGEIDTKKVDLLHRLSLNQRDVAVRIQVAEEFATCGWGQAAELDYPHPLTWLEETLAMNPTLGQVRRIYALLQDSALKVGDGSLAESYLIKMVAEFPNERNLDGQVYRLGTWYWYQGERDKGEKWLRWLADSHRHRLYSVSAKRVLSPGPNWRKLALSLGAIAQLSLLEEH